MYELVVTLAFGSYEVGDRIAEQGAMDTALAGHPGHVVRVLADVPVIAPPPAVVAPAAPVEPSA